MKALSFQVKDPVAQVLVLTGGRGGDAAFLATGRASVAPNLMELVRIRGQGAF